MSYDDNEREQDYYASHIRQGPALHQLDSVPRLGGRWPGVKPHEDEVPSLRDEDDEAHDDEGRRARTRGNPQRIFQMPWSLSQHRPQGHSDGEFYEGKGNPAEENQAYVALIRT